MVHWHLFASILMWLKERLQSWVINWDQRTCLSTSRLSILEWKTETLWMLWYSSQKMVTLCWGEPTRYVLSFLKRLVRSTSESSQKSSTTEGLLLPASNSGADWKVTVYRTFWMRSDPVASHLLGRTGKMRRGSGWRVNTSKWELSREGCACEQVEGCWWGGLWASGRLKVVVMEAVIEDVRLVVKKPNSNLFYSGLYGEVVVMDNRCWLNTIPFYYSTLIITKVSYYHACRHTVLFDRNSYLL